ncbi:hypothetical protein [Pararobbsia alpina]|uniref:Uncharacterized protein n=1 Tax=Pararobbsia alpina TaxID=621374 RepID=A0A6S7D4Q3_9BURK|nr:hypothetical protein LMG28138_05825 [Pararobbsia alpina]
MDLVEMCKGVRQLSEHGFSGAAIHLAELGPTLYKAIKRGLLKYAHGAS